MEYSLEELAQLIDHTYLFAAANQQQIEKLCQEAIRYHFKMVAINECQTKLCANLLKGFQVHVGAAISFPLGQTSLATKRYSALDAINDGADEIDYVINLSAVKNHNYQYIENEMQVMTELCHQHQVICKVIFENCYLNPQEITKLSQIAKRIRPDFIKTSTGFGTAGAKVEDVKLMRKIVKNQVGVKAAGGIRTANQFQQMLQAGATRIGTSHGVAIIEEIKQSLKENKQRNLKI